VKVHPRISRQKRKGRRPGHRSPSSLASCPGQSPGSWLAPLEKLSASRLEIQSALAWPSWRTSRVPRGLSVTSFRLERVFIRGTRVALQVQTCSALTQGGFIYSFLCCCSSSSCLLFSCENGSREVRFCEENSRVVDQPERCSSLHSGTRNSEIRQVRTLRQSRSVRARQSATWYILMYSLHVPSILEYDLCIKVSLASFARLLDFLSAIWNRYWLSRDF